LQRIQDAFEKAGVQLIQNRTPSLSGGPGVRFTEDGGLVPPKKESE
jgi:hypothetical protein